MDEHTGSVETPSGKGARDENFPVASFLIAPRLRPHVMRFYAFARAADDIADNPELTSEDKIARLDAFEAGLTGLGEGTAQRLAESLAETGVSDCHARTLLAAFRQDAVQNRYDSWADLIGYCTVSANPVGRYLLDLHGEKRAAWPASDALCTVLQILNHLQDAADDLAALNRVYVPGDWLAAEGLDVAVLRAPASPPGYRRVLDRMLVECEALLEVAATLPSLLHSRRLGAEARVIHGLARRLTGRLRAEDPLAGRVALSRVDFLRTAVGAVPGLLRIRR